MAPERYYRADKNTDGGSFPGVPLRDIETDEWNSYPEWLQRSVDASDLYQKTKPTDRKPAEKETE